MQMRFEDELNELTTNSGRMDDTNTNDGLT